MLRRLLKLHWTLFEGVLAMLALVILVVVISPLLPIIVVLLVLVVVAGAVRWFLRLLGWGRSPSS